MKKVSAAGFDATTTIKRSDFGVGAYAPAVSDEVRVAHDLSLTVRRTEERFGSIRWSDQFPRSSFS